MHFYSESNTYSFFRYLDNEAVFVFVNAGEQTNLPIAQYKEMLDIYGNKGVDVLTGKPVVLDEGLFVNGLDYLIVKLKK